MILEAKVKGTHLTGQYSFDKHQPHNSTGDYHVHVYKKGNQIFSINKSGKGHDGYSGTRIPNEVFTTLRDKFKDWNWPSNQIIESLNSTRDSNVNLRKVTVFPYKLDAQNNEGFEGYFHSFGDDPFLVGGNVGWVSRTVAIIENQEGRIKKVPIEYFRFTDIYL